jgi:hypothetical protein
MTASDRGMQLELPFGSPPQQDAVMDALLDLRVAARYDGDDRRRSCADYLGAERRVPDPMTEQDRPELYELPSDES